MVTIKDERLQIKSHSDELHKEVEQYFKKYPKLPNRPSGESQVEKELREDLDYLRRVLNK